MNIWPSQKTPSQAARAEGVETKRPPSCSQDDEIVRSARRRAELGGNDLAVLQWIYDVQEGNSLNAMYDLQGDANITNIWQYAGPRDENNQLFDISFKDLPMGFRVYETTNCRIFASLGLSGADVYATLVLGDEFYGMINLEALPAKIIVKPRGTSGISDPLDQLGSIGWKAAWTAVRLNEALCVRIEHATSSKNAA